MNWCCVCREMEPATCLVQVAGLARRAERRGAGPGDVAPEALVVAPPSIAIAPPEGGEAEGCRARSMVALQKIDQSAPYVGRRSARCLGS